MSRSETRRWPITRTSPSTNSHSAIAGPVIHHKKRSPTEPWVAAGINSLMSLEHTQMTAGRPKPRIANSAHSKGAEWLPPCSSTTAVLCMRNRRMGECSVSRVTGLSALGLRAALGLSGLVKHDFRALRSLLIPTVSSRKPVIHGRCSPVQNAPTFIFLSPGNVVIVKLLSGSHDN